MHYLGIDIGTSGCKAVVFDQKGRSHGSSYQSYSIISPEPGAAELDSSEVMQKCFEVIREAVAGSNGSEVKALCISSQGEAFTPVGENREIIGNGIVSSDSRAAKYVDTFDKISKDRLYHITGHTPYGMFSLYKLLWLKENRPETWKKSKAFYCYEDLLQMMLGVEQPAISWPLAGRTMLFDIHKHEWNQEILEAVEWQDDVDVQDGVDVKQIHEFALPKALPRPMPTGSIAGIIAPHIAQELGLPPDVKVITGGHDQTVGALGAGVTEEGTAMYATGTVECICPAFSEIHQSKELAEGNLCCYDFTLKDKYTTVAYSLTGGNILQWFKNEFGDKEIAKAEKTGKNVYEVLLSNLPSEPTDLLALPHFTPTGTPHFDAHAKGAIIGLQLSTTKYEIMKALLEGVSMEMKLNLDIMDRSGMKINKLIATGGGARSKAWTQLKANIMNRPISVIEVEEAGCFGAAMIACAAVTNNNVAQLVTQNRKELMEIEPQPEQVEIYEGKFEKYKTLYPLIQQVI
jgi:xylulokinase